MDYHILKEDDVFYLTDRDGGIVLPTDGHVTGGLFHRDTRFLSRLEWMTDPNVLVLLESHPQNVFETFYRYTNQPPSGASRIPRESLLVTRHQWIGDNSFHEEVVLENFSLDAVQLEVGYVVDADFVDMFEVRGFQQVPFHRTISVETRDASCRYWYVAQDGWTTTTQLSLVVHDGSRNRGDRDPGVVGEWRSIHDGGTARQWNQTLIVPAQGRSSLTLTIHLARSPALTTSHTATPGHRCSSGTIPSGRTLEQIRRSHDDWIAQLPTVVGNTPLADWYQQGIRDIRMLQSDLGYGPMVVAGVPWYAVPFGRDSLIAARQFLLASTDVARGTLLTMAHLQGQAIRPERDEQPGKIVHEVRAGELSRLGVLPFAPYYGSIDATPLFLMLLASYFHWTGDRDLIIQLLPQVERALQWMTEYGDRDHDGFLEYWREAQEGITNQGWKDSGDSVMHGDGSFLEGPVALCEVQAYAHRAYSDWSAIYTDLGMPSHANQLRQTADNLRERFQRQFVHPDGSVAYALDGAKRPSWVIASNLGHVLVSDLLPSPSVYEVARRMVSPAMLTGYGIRTLSEDAVRYNPLSYHNGSVWPHDTSLVAHGLRRQGHVSEALTLIENLLRAQAAFPSHRLPELFAGFSFMQYQQPVPYPVSCSPQAWAAATPVFILEQLLGLRPDAPRHRIEIDPILPQDIPTLEIHQIRLGHGTLSIKLTRRDRVIEWDVLANSTGWDLIQAAKGGDTPIKDHGATHRSKEVPGSKNPSKR